MKLEWAEVGAALAWVAGGVSATYGVVKAFTDGRELITDFIERRKPEYRDGYKVRSTIDKTVIRTDRTESIRLRTVRTYRRMTSLRMDRQPEIVPQGAGGRRARISNYYAFPGRASLTPDGFFQIDLMEDEALSAHDDHSVVLGYVMEESKDALFTPPGVIVEPPVGSDCLVIEVHFPPNCILSLDVRNRFEARVYSKDATNKETDLAADVISPDRTWIRARIQKPPQHCQICLDWQWQCA
ncbi:MAG TPA: hypothetical protein VGW33_10765 [Terriglobia bacterium]|nr:hypothetical protein [Terriglobia bacterium]